MFNKLKEKLKSWTKKLIEKAEKVEEAPAKEEKESKEVEMPVKFEVGTQKYEPDLEKLEETVKEIQKETKEIKKEVKKKELEEKVEIIEEKQKEEEESKPGKQGFFKKIFSRISKVKISEKEFEVYGEELNELLLENNVAFEVAEKIIEKLKEKIVDKELLKKELEEEIKYTLKEIIEEILVEPFDVVEKIKFKDEKPFVILFCGINGTGKTTTIAKIAHHLKEKKVSCILAGADTFRAASIEQIKKHADKLNLKVITHDYGSDPASVGFDAIKYAKKNNIDAVLIDTAGRMHTEKNLLKEIEKIARVCKPDLNLFVGEATTGNDSVEQVKSFDKAIGIDGIILTKADTDEKGGTALSLGFVTKKPILYLGVGQEYDKIIPFNKEKFVKELGL
jgi:fused signal recognition particle receptor